MTINCKGNLVDLSKPKVMGVLNITPDSFYDGGKYKNELEILNQTEKMLSEGATFIDVGAYSSRPGAKHISEEEELERIVPVINLLLKNFPETILSVDTFRSRVALETVNSGAAIVNDISGGNMDKSPIYKDVAQEIITFFAKQIFKLHQLKLNDVIIDVGFGFGKTIEHNYQILKDLSLFKSLDAPILAGVSRKSMLYKTLDISAKEALNATTSANTIALLNGASILRVHDVKEALEAIKIVEQVS
jgi:dihydropteroate synthase